MTGKKQQHLRAVVDGDLRRPQRIELEPEPGGGPLPGLADGRYMAVGSALVPYTPQAKPDDGTKSVRISHEAYARLRAMRGRGESASQAMERLIYEGGK